MKQKHSALDDFFDSDFEMLFEYIDEEDVDESRPIVAFLLPGIRSDKEWAQVFRDKANSPTARRIISEIVSPDRDLGLRDLLFRHRLHAFRPDYIEQIRQTLKKHLTAFGELDVIFICHSMGSAIFSEISDQILPEIERNKHIDVRNIVYLGSVSKRTYSTKVGKSCSKFVNDVGRNDVWPLAAWYINPLKYDPVGRFGFGRAMVHDRFFDKLDHTACTEMEHMEEWILPIVEDGIVKSPSVRRTNTFQNAHRLAQLLMVSLVLALGVVYFY